MFEAEQSPLNNSLQNSSGSVQRARIIHAKTFRVVFLITELEC